jgi:hypothetical protein
VASRRVPLIDESKECMRDLDLEDECLRLGNRGDCLDSILVLFHERCRVRAHPRVGCWAGQIGACLSLFPRTLSAADSRWDREKSRT